MPAGGKIVFDSPTNFHTIMKRGNEFFLVEVSIGG
jgi:hypothetical protein